MKENVDGETCLRLSNAALSRSAVRTPQTGKPRLGTKAQTLSSLKNVLFKSTVLDLYYFTVKQWQEQPGKICEDITGKFNDSDVIVRSSALCEDGSGSSKAGKFASVHNVKTAGCSEIKEAVNHVISSFEGNPEDQVLVQPMVTHTQLSGVATTHDIGDGAPYYVINYDDQSGRTDAITGGTGVNKTVFIYRATPHDHVVSERMRRIIEMTKELEEIFNDQRLDIEFAMSQTGGIFLFQVRPITTSGRWRADISEKVTERLAHIESLVEELSKPRAGIAGGKTILGNMPDWNPAEIIGSSPRALAVSLYRKIITRDVWRVARETMGYRVLPPNEELMVVIGGRPYIDVRSSFNSFLPQGLDDATSCALVDAWLNRLAENPELHDKVEFEIAQTCFDFTFDDDFRGRYGSLLSGARLAQFRDNLKNLTCDALDMSENGSLARALGLIEKLSAFQSARTLPRPGKDEKTLALANANALLDECKTMGTFPFAIIARHAFIAESLIRAAIKKGAFEPERIRVFKRSIRTVSSDFTDDFRSVYTGAKTMDDFLARYGHLRPGTYNALSPRYADRDDIFASFLSQHDLPAKPVFNLTAAERENLNQLIYETIHGAICADELLEYYRRAIKGREYAKFCFTRNISDALEWLACWAEGIGLTRKDLVNLSIDDIFDSITTSSPTDHEHDFQNMAEAEKENHQVSRAIKLGFLIKGVKDLYVVPVQRNMANFVGEEHIYGLVALVTTEGAAQQPLSERIALIENADPGFDWVFSQGIKGLITRYGGVNSHMTIRCSEFGLPAAIGCGEQAFNRISKSGAVELNCKEKIVRPINEH